jgi:hypothetical protein
MSKKYKVNVPEILLKNNKIAFYGDLVSADQLSSDASKLEQSGFLVSVSVPPIMPVDENVPVEPVKKSAMRSK